MQIASPVVREDDVDSFVSGGIAIGNPDSRHLGARVGLDRMVDSVDNVGVWRKEGIGFDFFEGLGDGFLAERTPDFLERVESRGGGILDEVDVREATLGKLTSAWFKIDS